MLGTTKNKLENKGFELVITTAPIPDLNDKLIVFGRVVKGEDVVQVKNLSFLSNPFITSRLGFLMFNLLIRCAHQEIEEVDTDEHYRPKSPVGITSVTLKREI